MPAVLSHYLLAKRVIKDLQIYEPQLKLNETAFFWGSCGPDIFFAHRIMPWQRGKSLSYLAKILHNSDADKLLNYLAAYAKHRESDTALSYALGFATHYAFDSTAHPYICHLAEIMSDKSENLHASVCHNDIESSLDTLFLKYETGKNITSFKMQNTTPFDDDVACVIADMLCGYFMSYHIPNIKKTDLIQVQKDWHTSLTLLNDRTTLKKKAIILGEKAVHIAPMLSPIIRSPKPDLSIDYANVKHNILFCTDSDGNCKHNESFFELADMSEELSLKLILTLTSGKKLLHEQCKASF